MRNHVENFHLNYLDVEKMVGKAPKSLMTQLPLLLWHSAMIRLGSDKVGSHGGLFFQSENIQENLLRRGLGILLREEGLVSELMQKAGHLICLLFVLLQLHLPKILLKTTQELNIYNYSHPLISTEGALRRPMTYDNYPSIRPSIL